MSNFSTGFSKPVHWYTSSDGKYIAGSSNGITYAYDVETGEKVVTLHSNLHYRRPFVEHRAYTEDSVWDLDVNDEVASLSTMNSTANLSRDEMAISPDGKLMAAYDGEVVIVDGTITGYEIILYVVDIESDSILYRFRGHNNYAYFKVYFSPDSQRLVSMSRDGSVLVWDTSH